MKISRGASIDRYYLFKRFGLGIFLHKIHHSDPPGLYHSHPWSGLSLILGSYTEVRHAKPPQTKILLELDLSQDPSSGDNPSTCLDVVHSPAEVQSLVDHQ